MDNVAKKYIKNMQFQLITGNLKNLKCKEHYSSSYIDSNPGEINTCPNIHVINNNPLDILIDMNIKNPGAAIIQIVDCNFDGDRVESLQGIIDESIFTRTNFINSLLNKKNIEQIYPIDYKKEPMCGVVEDVKIIYDANMKILQNTILTSVITSAQINNKCTFNSHGYFNYEDYVLITKIIETQFQTAINNNIQILLLNPFCHNFSDDLCVKNIIEIYNYCLCKYSHLISCIVFAISKKYDPLIFNIFEKNIISPDKDYIFK